MSAKRKSSSPTGGLFSSPRPRAAAPSALSSSSPFISPRPRAAAPTTPPFSGKKTKLPIEPDFAFQSFARRVQAQPHGGSVITVADWIDQNQNKVVDFDEFAQHVADLGFDDLTADKEGIRNLFEHILKYETASPSPVSPRTLHKEQKQRKPSFGYFAFIKAINDGLFVTPSKRRLRDYVLYWSPKDLIPSWQVRFALDELSISYTSALSQGTTVDPSDFYGTPPLRREAPVLTVNKFDVESTFSGADAILLYLAHTKGLIADPKVDEPRYAKTISRFHETHNLAKILDKDTKYSEEQLRAELAIWNGYLENEDYLATEFSIADIALFPLLATVHTKGKLPAALVNYYKRIAARPSALATRPASVVMSLSF